jgi:hypothetical protein
MKCLREISTLLNRLLGGSARTLSDADLCSKFALALIGIGFLVCRFASPKMSEFLKPEIK